MIAEAIAHAGHARVRIDAALAELAWTECDRAACGTSEEG